MNEDVTIRSMYAPLERPDEVDGSLVAIHALSILFAAAALLYAGYAIGTGHDVASACLMAIAGPGVAVFMTWALYSRAVQMMDRRTGGTPDDSKDRFRALLKRG